MIYYKYKLNFKYLVGIINYNKIFLHFFVPIVYEHIYIFILY